MLSEKNYRALLEYRNEKYTGPKMTEQIRYFKECDYIRATSHELKEQSGDFCMNPTAWVITPHGEDALAEFEYVAQQKADEKSQKKKDRAFDVFLVIFGAIVGLLIEHFSGIIGWLVSLF